MSESPAQWWRYTLVSIGRLTRRRSWPAFLGFLKRRSRYIGLYTRARYATPGHTVEVKKDDYDYLSKSKLMALSDEEGRELERLQFEVPCEVVLGWRDLAEARHYKANPKPAAKTPWWKGGASKERSASEETGISDEDFKAFEDDYLRSNQELVAGSIMLKASFFMSHLSLTLINQTLPITTFAASKLKTTATVLSSKAKVITASLGALLAEDLSTPETLYKSFIRQSSLEDGPVLSFNLNQTPNDDSDVKLSLAGFVISPTAPFVSALQDFVAEESKIDARGSEGERLVFGTSKRPT